MSEEQKQQPIGLMIAVIILAVLFLGSTGSCLYYFFKARDLNEQIKQLNSQIQNLQSQLSESTASTKTTEKTEESKPSTSTSTTESKTTISGSYVISDSDTREISESELKNLTPWELKVARNEIYARHGREFVHKDLGCYFAQKTWYSVNPNYSDSMLSTIENKNIAILLAYEKKINSPLLQKDSGC